MEIKRRRKIVAVLLAVIALASVAVANYASALQVQGGITESAVFANEQVAVIELPTGAWAELVSITLPNIPMSGYYHVVADGMVTSTPDPALVAVGLSVDSPGFDIDTWRAFNIITGTDLGYTGVHTERVYHLGPGSHTFYFYGEAWQGTVSAGYRTIIVSFFTHGGITELA